MYEQNTHLLRANTGNLRNKIRSNRILTVRGVGYRLHVGV